jgi:DNA-binding MarR family transcriptional regulator
LDSTVFVLSKASVEARRRVGEHLGAVGLDRWRFAVLTTLAETGAVSQREIAARLGVDPSDLVDVMAGMHDDGLVERLRDPSDRRRYQVTLTTAGRAMIKRMATVMAAANEEIFAPLDERERRELHRLLRLLYAHLEPRAVD